MKNKITTLFTAISISCLSVFAQLSEGGLPPSFKHQSMLRSAWSPPEHAVDVNLDVERLLWQDSIATKNGSPLRVAEVLPVHVDIKTSGQWTTLPDSVKVWRQTVTAKDAVGLLISYDDFYIPRGGKLFIYNKDKTQVLGAYTNNTHPEGGRFASEAVSGDSFTLEYVASTKSVEEPRIVISSVGYMYNRNIMREENEPWLNSPYYGGGASCRINVNCADGKNWQDQKRGVVLYFIYWTLGNEESAGKPFWAACTGSLVNNTKQDATPYLLTAQHCFKSDPVFNTVIAYFNFEFSGCRDGTISPEYQTLVGVTPLVQVPLQDGSDHFLVQFKDKIPKEYKPYFNGWDRRDIPAKNGVVIHHPNKDVKKIITYVDPLVSDRYVPSEGEVGAPDAHWKAVYDGNSVSEGGSSGSPIFNENGLIVGTLTGGRSFCHTPKSPDYYGKLWYGWDQYPLDKPYDQHLKIYLDPLGKGVETLGGYDPYGNSGIGEEIEDTKELVLFPNPAESELNVNTDSIIRRIKIFDLQGRRVFSQENYSASTAIIPLSSWNTGVYTIIVETDSKKLTDKFMKK